MALHVLNCNENSGDCAIPHMGLRSLDACVRPTAKNLGVKMDSDFKLDKQINSMLKSSFFQLGLLSKLKPFLFFKNFDRVIHAFISSRLDY